MATAKVVRFESASNTTNWIAAESKEQALNHFNVTLKPSDVDISTIDIHEVDIKNECILVKEEEVSAEDRKTFKSSKVYEGRIEVPYVYAIEQDLQTGIKLPYIIQTDD